MVNNRGRSAANRLDHAQRGRQPHIFFVHSGLQLPDNIFEPIQQRSIGAVAAHKGLLQMSMGIGQPRQQYFVAAIDAMGVDALLCLTQGF